jgi:hypothetical protein
MLHFFAWAADSNGIPRRYKASRKHGCINQHGYSQKPGVNTSIRAEPVLGLIHRHQTGNCAWLSKYASLRLSDSQRMCMVSFFLPGRLLEPGDKISEILRRELFFKPIRHQRFARRLDLLDFTAK